MCFWADYCLFRKIPLISGLFTCISLVPFSGNPNFYKINLSETVFSKLLRFNSVLCNYAIAINSIQCIFHSDLVFCFYRTHIHVFFILFMTLLNLFKFSSGFLSIKNVVIITLWMPLFTYCIICFISVSAFIHWLFSCFISFLFFFFSCFTACFVIWG